MKRSKQSNAQANKIMSSGEWELMISRKRFRTLRADPEFHHILALARIINSIRFANAVMLPAFGEPGPDARRQCICGLFFVGALLYEGMMLVERMGKSCRERRSWQPFVKLLRDPTVAALRKMHLSPLRKHATFHSDEAAFAEYVNGLDAQNTRFVWGNGVESAHNYYELADTAAISTLVGLKESNPDYERKLGEIIGAVASLAREFIGSSDKLIAEILRGKPGTYFRTTRSA